MMILSIPLHLLADQLHLPLVVEFLILDFYHLQAQESKIGLAVFWRLFHYDSLRRDASLLKSLY